MRLEWRAPPAGIGGFRDLILRNGDLILQNGRQILRNGDLILQNGRQALRNGPGGASTAQARSGRELDWSGV
ncbi:hypothetical protein [Microbacterium tumbae]